MGNNTIVSAQMSMAGVLKPRPDFETLYQGRSVSAFPIAIPGTADFRAGDRGYDPNLIAGVPIPLGSRLLLWLPQFIVNEGVVAIPYRFRILWRIRTPDDAVNAMQSNPGLTGHLAGPSAGVPADGGASGNVANERIIIPAAIDSVGYEEPQPVSAQDIATLSLHHEQVVVGGQSFEPTGPPIVDNTPTFGVVSQGVYPQSNNDLIGPTFLPFQTDAFGDEYLILMHRADDVANWDFEGQDAQISALFGTAGGTRAPIPGLGIYAFHGSGAT